MKTTRPVGGFKGLIASVNGDGANGWVLAATVALLLLLQLGGAATLAALRYDRNALAAGQWCRLASCLLYTSATRQERQPTACKVCGA